MNAIFDFRLSIFDYFRCAAAFLLFLAPVCRAADQNPKLVPALGWDIKKQGGFPVSLASDAGGNIWVGTEGNGVWKYDAAKKDWTQFTTANGLGDDSAYAVAVDNLNRVWVGHLNHGVSVYNGDKWRNYGLVDGPIGDRVFSIVVSPKDGDVWMATDMGLARYSEKRKDWDYYTRASGLPSDQIQSMTFDEKGRLFIGTQCNGIAFAGPDSDYNSWRHISSQDTLLRVPAAEAGGLVSDLTNDVQAVTATGMNGVSESGIACLTPFGASVAASDTLDNDQKGSWDFIHGQDWRDHTPGPYDNLGPMTAVLPAEDWMTALQHSGMNFWLGFRKAGVESRDLTKNPMQPEARANVEKPGSVIIRAILTLPFQPPLFAAYDKSSGGLLTLDNAPPFKPAGTGANANGAPPDLPVSVPLPALDDAKALTAQLGKLTQQLAPGEAYYLADDWRTEGDWIGRYGSGYAKLCGMSDKGDKDYELQPGYAVSIQLGPHHEADAQNPAWHHEDDTSDDLRSLWEPALGHRRDAEDNDLSNDPKTYPESYDGPDLWVRTKVPEGVQCLSFYFLNSDAHATSDDKYRDYDVQIFSDPNGDGKIKTGTPLARTRVTDFWGGVYKQFLVCGPASYVVRIGRNRSFGTRLNAVFLDPVTQESTDNPGHLPGFDTAPYSPPNEPDNYHPTPLTEAAVNLWSKLDDALSLRGAVSLQMPFRIWCYRAAIAGQAPPDILERWRWQISIWTPEDRKKFDDAMKAAHNAAN